MKQYHVYVEFIIRTIPGLTQRECKGELYLKTYAWTDSECAEKVSDKLAELYDYEITLIRMLAETEAV